MHPFCRYIPPRRQFLFEKSYVNNTSTCTGTKSPEKNKPHVNINLKSHSSHVIPNQNHPGASSAIVRHGNTAFDDECPQHGSFLAVRLVRLFKTAADAVINPFLSVVLGELENPATIDEYEAEDARFHRNLISSSTISPETASTLSTLSLSSSDLDLRCNTDMGAGEQLEQSPILASNAVQRQTMSLNLRPRREKQPTQANPPRVRLTQTIDFTEMFGVEAGQQQENNTSTGTEETPSTVDNEHSSIKRTRNKLMKAKSKLKLKRKGKTVRGSTTTASASTTSEVTSQTQTESSQTDSFSTESSELQEEQSSSPVISDCTAPPQQVAEASAMKEQGADTAQDVTQSTILPDTVESPSCPAEPLHLQFSRLCRVMEESRRAGKQSVSLDYLRGPLKVCSHLCRGTRNITVVRMVDGMFVLHGVKRLLEERYVCDDSQPSSTHVSVYIVDGVYVGDLKGHYAVVLLAAYVTFESGYCDRLLHYACTRERGTKVDDEVLALVDQLSAKKRLRPNNGLRKDLLKYINTKHCLDQIEALRERETNTPRYNDSIADDGAGEHKSSQDAAEGNDKAKEGSDSSKDEDTWDNEEQKDGEGESVQWCGDEDENEPEYVGRDSCSPAGSKGVYFDDSETMVSDLRLFDISAKVLTSSHMWRARFRPAIAHGDDEPGSCIESSSEETRNGMGGKRKRAGDDGSVKVEAEDGKKKVRLES